MKNSTKRVLINLVTVLIGSFGLISQVNAESTNTKCDLQHFINYGEAKVHLRNRVNSVENTFNNLSMRLSRLRFKDRETLCKTAPSLGWKISSGTIDLNSTLVYSQVLGLETNELEQLRDQLKRGNNTFNNIKVLCQRGADINEIKRFVFATEVRFKKISEKLNYEYQERLEENVKEKIQSEMKECKRSTPCTRSAGSDSNAKSTIYRNPASRATAK